MGSNNTKINSRANAVATAWANLATGDSFAGLTLQQYTQLVSGLQSQSAHIQNVQAQYVGANKLNDEMHQRLNGSTQAVVNAVRADLAKHGPDSPLYKTMGYVPKSERASGLTRKATATATGTTAGTAGVPATATSGSVKN